MKKIKRGLGLTMAAAMALSAAAMPAVYADDEAGADVPMLISLEETADQTTSNEAAAPDTAQAQPVADAEVISAPAEPGFDNFRKTAEYKEFSDVSSSEWYHDYIKSAYELGLVKGMSETEFSPQGKLTLAEAITLASRLRDIYNGGNEKFIPGQVWYEVYVDYAVEAGIISDAGKYADYNKAATRSEFAEIMAAALPAEALTAINEVTLLPDVTAETPASKEIFALYQAGILKGNDEKGTYRPDSSITRAEVSTIILRMADPSQRESVTFTTIDTAAALGEYKEMIDTVKNGLAEGWTGEDAEKLNYSYMLGSEYGASAGYVQKDINGDDIDELIFGDLESNQIFQLLSIDNNGEVVNLFVGGERDVLYLMNDGTLYNIASSSAAETTEAAYTIKDGALAAKDGEYKFDEKNIADPGLTKLAESTGMANPWVDTTPAEIKSVLGLSVNIPDGAADVVYRMNETIKMEEVIFTLDGLECNLRAQAADELTDISGLYIEWNPEYTDEAEIVGFSGIVQTAILDGKTYELCLWYDPASKITYSLSVESTDDLNGFDITGLAEIAMSDSVAVVS